MGGPKHAGTVPLPRICGFAEEFFFAHKLKADDEQKMSSMLGNPRFQKGNRAARSYANLVVLFRLLLFYGALKHHPQFWEWIAKDWGIAADRGSGPVASIANFYSDARYAALGRNDQRLSLLVRLVDEWLMIRPRPEFPISESLDDATVQNTRRAWLQIRDWHVDMLMDAKLPACLVGVETPTKIVTSLWETDPEVAALLKEIKTTRKPKAYLNKTAVSKSPSVRSLPIGFEKPRKRKNSLSEGEIDETASSFTYTDPMFDERSFSPHAESNWHPGLFSVPVGHQQKRIKLYGSNSVPQNHVTKSAESFDLIDFTPTEPRSPAISQAPAPASQPMPQPAQSTMPQLDFFCPNPPPIDFDILESPETAQPSVRPPPGLVKQVSPQFDYNGDIKSPKVAPPTVLRPPPGLVQMKEPQFDYSGASDPVPDMRDVLKTEMQKIAGQIRRHREHIRVRVDTETTGCVPLTRGPDANGGTAAIQVVGGLVASEERELYESRLRDMEARMAALERAHREDSNWARAMGNFLYDANEQSLKSLRAVFAFMETLQQTSSALLEGDGKRNQFDSS
ncbi:hypothetical protein NLG97_g2372 [Lecanicillium saksenae]|uniref:Uncharacterized protein n=1 Tax=Lecanicillium saksenae TaxID=468837 RepID=A0ACC1R138_9HYPO|nr:hypothetical protein NLG97_g2372 [Lecanicillium saksenae]